MHRQVSQAGSGILRPILNLRPSSALQCLQTRSSWQVPTVTSLMPSARMRFSSLSLLEEFDMPYRPKLDPNVDLAGATPETLARALFRPLRPRAEEESAVGGEPPVGENVADEPDDRIAHLVRDA